MFSQYQISIHKALAGLDQFPTLQSLGFPGISIHKALAGLDGKEYGIVVR